jgi:hypothetical protein
MANAGVCSIVSLCPKCGATRGGIEINKAILRACCLASAISAFEALPVGTFGRLPRMRS